LERKASIQKELRAHQRNHTSGFDNRIQMRPGIVAALARFHGIIRDLVEARWVRKVRDLNGLALGERDLHAHLFGLERAQLVALCGPLRELHGGRCFYCDGRLGAIDIDHFLPWARYPENRLENLVPTHARCNQSKAAHLAAVEHLERWLQRFVKQRDDLAEVSRTARWPTGGLATLSISRLLYTQQPEAARLWFAKDDFRTWKRAEVHNRIAATVEQLPSAA
jgi:5-methylcytosine-specific restriction endonuclease McrA